MFPTLERISEIRKTQVPVGNKGNPYDSKLKEYLVKTSYAKPFKSPLTSKHISQQKRFQSS